MSDQLRGGLVGCGYVSAFHLHGWQRQQEASLVAVCDLDVQRAEQAAREYGVPHFYGSLAKLLAEQSLDFVEICTRPESHEALIATAAAHGVHILCQKPIALNLESIDRMIETANRHTVRLMVHENWRFRPWLSRMHQTVRDETIGEPVRLRVNARDFRCLADGGLDDQPYFSAMKRFVLFEIGPHLVDVARQFFGDPESVFCLTTHSGPQAGEDGAHLVLEYPDGRAAVLDMCWATAPHPDDVLEWGYFETVLEGTKATIRTAKDGQLLLQRPDGECDAVEVGLADDPRQQSYADTQAHFVECLKTGRPFLTGIEQTRNAMAVIFAGYQSASSKQVVRPAY